MTDAQLEQPAMAGPNGEDKVARRARKLARREEKRAAKKAAQPSRAKLAAKEKLDPEEVAKLLEHLAAGVRSGHVTAKSSDREITLESVGSARVRLKARSGPRKARLSVRICWSKAKAKPAATSAAAT